MMEYDHEVMMYWQRRYMQANINLVVLLLLSLAFYSVVLGHVEMVIIFLFTSLMLISQILAMDVDGYCRSIWSKVIEPRWRPMDEWEEDLVDRGKIPE